MGRSVPCTISRVISFPGSRVGNVVITGSETGDDGDGEGFGISLSFLKNFLFLNDTLPVPSTKPSHMNLLQIPMILSL